MTAFQKIELLGLGFILISVGWELFFTRTLDSMKEDIKWNILMYRLDQLHDRQHDLQQHIDYKIYEVKSGKPLQGVPLSKHWNNSASEDSLAKVADQNKYFYALKLVLYLLGGTMVLFAKFGDYSNSPSKRQTLSEQKGPVVSCAFDATTFRQWYEVRTTTPNKSSLVILKNNDNIMGWRSGR